MPRRDLSQRDASDYAASELDYIIKSKKLTAEAKVPTVSAQQAMRGARLVEVSTNRDVTRVLFISQNDELLNPVKQTLDGYLNISDLFDEVHILILRRGIPSPKPVLRVSDNVWIYTASGKSWWEMYRSGIEMAAEQLEFASGFRPDLIVARDPFESAYVAYKLGQKYNRSTQLHVLDDYTTKEFRQKKTSNFWRVLFTKFIIPKFASVRTLTSNMQTVLQKKFTIPDISTLPRYQNYELLIESTASIDLKDKYRPFIFFLLYVGKLDYNSTLYRMIDAARFVLRNPRVGLLVLGNGVAVSEFNKRAKILGIDKQVVFETRVKNIEPYLKSANILLVSDTDFDSEELVLKGAAAGIPMVMSRTEKREDVFKHGESAFLCEESDVQAFSDCINDLLNNISLRRIFKDNGQEIIRQQFHTDPTEYQEAYRVSIEQAFFVESDKEVNDSEQSD